MSQLSFKLNVNDYSSLLLKLRFYVHHMGHVFPGPTVSFQLISVLLTIGKSHNPLKIITALVVYSRIYDRG